MVWIDPRGRQFKVDDLALVAFKGIAQWEKLLESSIEPMCVRVLRTKVEALTLDRERALLCDGYGVSN